MSKYENVKVRELDYQFRKLLNDHFEYTTNTEKNRNVRQEIQDDVWCIFLKLIAEGNFDEETSNKIFSLIHQEILRRQKLV